jgi:DNA ligase 1
VRKTFKYLDAYSSSMKKTKPFEPVLYPNETTEIEDIRGEYLASNKMDGHRWLFIDGELKSRHFKPMPNFRLIERFKPLTDFSKQTGIILDGEIYSHELSFKEIGHFLRTIDTKDEVIPESIKFHCFEIFDPKRPDLTAKDRYEIICELEGKLGEHFVVVKQRLVCGQEEIKKIFDDAVEEGYEGIMLKSPHSTYKFGRYTLKSGMAYKLKKFTTTDGKIISVEQATKVREDAEKKTNELGRSVTSKKKDDRVLIEKASSFVVKFGDTTVKVPIALSDEEKEGIWLNRDSYIGKWIEYKYQEEGMDEKPRIPIFLRYREDKD